MAVAAAAPVLAGTGAAPALAATSGHSHEATPGVPCCGGGDGHYWLCVSGTAVNIGYNGGTPSIACGWQ